jgi:hypothetical protein
VDGIQPLMDGRSESLYWTNGKVVVKDELADVLVAAGLAAEQSGDTGLLNTGGQSVEPIDVTAELEDTPQPWGKPIGKRGRRG